MLIERMPEQQLIKEELNVRVDRNIDSDMEKLAALFSRYSLDLEDTPPLGVTLPEIAKSLSSIKIEDPHIVERVIGISSNPDEATADDYFFIGALALGAAMVREKNSFFTQKEKRGLSHYKDKIKSEAGRKIAGVTRKAISAITLFSFINSACGAKITPSNPDLSPTREPVPTEFIPPPTKEAPQVKETQIAPSPTQESMKNILLTSIEVMTEEEIQADPLLSDPNFQEGINNYIQEARETRGLSEENTIFELVVIRGTTTEGNEMLFPFAAWTAQNKEGLTFVEMIGVAEEGLVIVTLEHQEIEKNGVLHYVLVLQDVGPIFAIPASEIDNPEADISFSPSGKAIELPELKIRAKVLFALKPEIETPEIKVSDITDDVRLFVPTETTGERKVLPFGISEHFRLPSSIEGLRPYLLSGILLEKPYYDGNGFVIFRLGIPDNSQDRFRELFFNTPIGVIPEEGVVGLPITKSIKSVLGGYSLYNKEVRFFVSEEALDIYEKSIGKQIAFWIEIGLTEESHLEDLKYIQEIVDQMGTSRSDIYEELINRNHEYYEVLVNLKNGNIAYEKKEVGVLTSQNFVPYSYTEWE